MTPFSEPAAGRQVPGAPVVLVLLVLNGLFFWAQQSFNMQMVVWLALWPWGAPDVISTVYGRIAVPGFEIWQVVSYGFLHGGFTHLFFNMFALWMFGTQIERFWGSRRFFVYYMVCVIGAGVVQLIVASVAVHNGGPPYPTIGASGGVFGILLAFGMLFPNQRILLLIPPIPIKAKWFVILYGLIELWAGIWGTEAGVAHFAHLGGMLVGFLMILYWRSKTPPGFWPYG